MKVVKPGFMLGLLVVSLFITACTTSTTYYAPVGYAHSQTPTVHIVKKGETVYSIAWQYGMDYRRLAKLNRLSNDYHISRGQKLFLQAAASHEQQTRPNLQLNPPYSEKKRNKSVILLSKNHKKSIRRKWERTPEKDTSVNREWSWPANGTVIGHYSLVGVPNKGIDIGGKSGQPIYAAAAGVVAYSGNGLGGYGKLIIIKHDNVYLSAYAHNRKILVKEGQVVKIGSKIAEMGSSGSDRVKLHFEIRRLGKPVNPEIYLPKRG